jgi:small subunit ribosomal protein S19e
MTSIRDTNPKMLIERTAKELGNKIAMPNWALYVKTGACNERPPEQKDWFYIRAASMLRRIYLDGPVGVSRLRTYYGARKRRGHKQAHTRKAGGKIIRTILHELEKINLIEKVDKPKKGRRITKEAQRFLNKLAKDIK